MNIYAIQIQHFMTLTQKIITHRVLKISYMDGREFVWARGSFFKDDKWEIKLLSEFLFKWIKFDGIYMSGGKFIKPWQVTNKIIEWIFMQFTLNILGMTLTQIIITRRVLKIQKWIDMRGFV